MVWLAVLGGIAAASWLTVKIHRFRYHRNHWIEDINRSHEDVYMTFDQWKTYYNADPDHWSEATFEDHDSIWAPVYRTKNKDYQVSFLTIFDYYRFINFCSKIQRTGQDTKNVKDMLELTEIIQAEAAKRAEKARKESQEAFDKMVAMQEQVAKEGLRTWP